MQNQLYPEEITEFSTEFLIKKHSRKSHIIYWLLLLSFTALVVSLFIINVDINVQSRGIITTNERTAAIVVPVYGRISQVQIIENTYVNKGDLLLLLDTTEISRSIFLTKENLKRYQSFISDLELITYSSENRSIINIAGIKTDRYQQEVNKYIADLNYQQSEIDMLKKEYYRQALLYDTKVIATAEYDQSTFKYENSLLRYQQLQSTQISTWQNELEEFQTQYISFHQSLIDQQRELDKHFILAAFDGYIQGISGISEGSTVFSGQEVATLIPNSELVAETYISTSDIGMLYHGQKTRLRIDAYDANTWGFAEASIREVANDVSVYNGHIQGFRVICAIHSDSLKYQHKAVKIKRGMSLTANFILMKRTLAQLLYDKMSDWMNPNVIKKEDY